MKELQTCPESEHLFAKLLDFSAGAIDAFQTLIKHLQITCLPYQSIKK